jgi:hypothetical protein
MELPFVPSTSCFVSELPLGHDLYPALPVGLQMEID